MPKHKRHRHESGAVARGPIDCSPAPLVLPTPRTLTMSPVHLGRWFHTIPAMAVFLLIAREPCVAQVVQGRVLQPPADTPVAGALLVLVDSAGQDVARAATSASGGYTLAAGTAGSYRIVVRQIG